MSTRVSLIFGFTSEAADRASASPHSGSWSEGVWDNTTGSNRDFIRDLAQARAAMLPKQAAVIGYRTAIYSIVGNRLVPGGTASVRFLYPGLGSIDCDMPQVALQLSLSAAGGNTSRMSLRGMPDEVITKGEYQPDAAFARALSIYLKKLEDDGWGFIGRNLTNPTAHIVSIAGDGTVVLRNSIGLAEGNYVRLLKVKNTSGKPVKGVFRIGAVTGGGTTFTLQSYPAGNPVSESGSLRKDEIAFCDISNATFARAVVRKIGSPIERYRGRASKKTR